MSTGKSVARNYDLYIFDFDGTIIDSKQLMMEALRHCYRLHSNTEEPPFDRFFSMMGDSLENIFTALGLSLELTRDYKLYSTKNMEKVRVFKPVIDALYLLKQRRKKVVLFTGKDKVRTFSLLKKFCIDELFDNVLTSNDVVHPKPAPEGIEWLMHLQCVRRDRTLMIGDGLFDILAANRAGVDSVFFRFGTGRWEEIEPLSPTFTYATPECFADAIAVKEDHLMWRDYV